MAGFWSAIGFVIKSLFTGNDESKGTGWGAVPGIVVPDQSYRYAIARFSEIPTADESLGDLSTAPIKPDFVSDTLARSLAMVPDSQAVLINQFFVPKPDSDNPLQALRDAQLNALNAAHRENAEVIFYGSQNPATGHIEIHLISDALSSSLYDLIMPLAHCFIKPDHKDTVEAMHILLGSELVLQAWGNEKRSLQIARLTTHLEALQGRIDQGESFEAAGTGVATSFALGAYMLAETGDRTYCASALKVMEPIARNILLEVYNAEKVAAKPKAPTGLLAERLPQKEVVAKEMRTENLIAEICDFSKIDFRQAAVLSLYGAVLNWSLIGNKQLRSGAIAIGIWRLLERRIEFLAGSVVDCAGAICKLADAMVAHGKDTENVKFSDAGAKQFRRAIGMLNSRTHGPLYAIAAYGLAEAIVTSAQLKDVHIPDEQVLPVFQASLKVCSRQKQPYLWGRTMFALATVQVNSASQNKDSKLLNHARLNFLQAYEALTDACAKGAARAAFGGYTRTENLLSQFDRQKAVTDTAGGETAAIQA